MILAALAIAVTPLPDTGALLDCARNQQVTLVASHFESGDASAAARQARLDGAAFIWLQIVDIDGILAVSGSQEPLGALLQSDARTGAHLILEPGQVTAGRIAETVTRAGAAHRVMIVVPDDETGAIVQSVDPQIGLVRTGIEDRYAVLSSELDQTRMAAWFEFFPDAHMGYFLTGQGIETIIPDFPGEEAMTADDFALVRQLHVDVLVTRQTADAVAVLGRVGDHCRAESD